MKREPKIRPAKMWARVDKFGNIVGHVKYFKAHCDYNLRPGEVVQPVLVTAPPKVMFNRKITPSDIKRTKTLTKKFGWEKRGKRHAR